MVFLSILSWTMFFFHFRPHLRDHHHPSSFLPSFCQLPQRCSTCCMPIARYQGGTVATDQIRPKRQLGPDVFPYGPCRGLQLDENVYAVFFIRNQAYSPRICATSIENSKIRISLYPYLKIILFFYHTSPCSLP